MKCYILKCNSYHSITGKFEKKIQKEQNLYHFQWVNLMFFVVKLLLMLHVRRDLNAPQHCFVGWRYATWSVCYSRMRRTFISIHQSATKTIVFGRAARKQMSDLIAWSLNARSSLSACYGITAVCFDGKGRLHFVDENAKVNAEYYVGRLLPELIADCKRLLPAGFIFQQDCAPEHTAYLVQDWLN